MKLNALDIVTTVAGCVVWAFAGFLKLKQPATSDTFMYVLIAVGGVFINPIRLFGLINLWKQHGGSVPPGPGS